MQLLVENITCSDNAQHAWRNGCYSQLKVKVAVSG